MEQYIKYPRTPHLPGSPGTTSDDKILTDLRHFAGKEVVVTEKRDGENTSLYATGLHARSRDSRSHPSRSWLFGWHATVRHTIPQDWRVCGEYLYARHSLGYNNLRSYFEAFSVWNDRNEALSWDDTVAFCEERGIVVVPTLWRGVFSEKQIAAIVKEIDTQVQEGFVVRLADAFAFEQFPVSLAKWVRKGHVQEGQDHWTHQAVVPNGLQRVA